MAEHILVPGKDSDVPNVTPRIARAGRFAVDGISGWRRHWLIALVAMQLLCEKLLLVDGAIFLRKKVARYKVKVYWRPDGLQG